MEVEGAKLTTLGDNVFSALYHYLSGQVDKVDPFMRSRMSTIMDKVKLWVNKAMMVGNDTLNLEKRTASMKNRDRAKMATTFHAAGMVVPYDKNTEVTERKRLRFNVPICSYLYPNLGLGLIGTFALITKGIFGRLVPYEQFCSVS